MYEYYGWSAKWSSVSRHDKIDNVVEVDRECGKQGRNESSAWRSMETS